ncbi:MAG TPA: universal stress protein [Gaiellales bacterium]|nr:universal stress protein [Gaiellales bacterium]
MSIVIQPRRPPAMRVRMQRRPAAAPKAGASALRPIIVAVDGSAAGRAATAEAIAAARELDAPVVLVHVRRAPSSVWGSPSYERRLERSLRRGREALAAAAAQAKAAGVEAQTEILEGRPAQRIAEFARARDAQLVILGPRRRWAVTSIFRGVAAAGLPVARAAPPQRA